VVARPVVAVVRPNTQCHPGTCQLKPIWPPPMNPGLCTLSPNTLTVKAEAAKQVGCRRPR
jgi:hypothetical protein